LTRHELLYLTPSPSVALQASRSLIDVHLFVNYSRLTVRKQFIADRDVKVWNSLPFGIDDFRSLHKFQHLILRVNFVDYLVVE